MKYAKFISISISLYVTIFLATCFLTPFYVTMTLTIITFLIAIIMFLCCRTHRKTLNISFIVSTIIYTIMAVINLYGTFHGMYDWKKPVVNTLYAIQHSPNTFTSTLQSKKEDSIIILYRFGCSDCEAIYDELSQEITETNIPVYWLSSRSKEGQEFLEQYPVTYVPTGICITHDTDVPYIQKRLNKNGTFDRENWERLVELKTKDI